MTATLTCERCGKRLTKKTARQIEGIVMCSPCMFNQTKQGEAK